MSQADFRKVGYPRYSGAGHVLCTGDTNRFETAYINTNEDEDLSGVTKCVFVGSRGFSYSSDDEQLELDMGGSHYASYTYSFSFVPDPKDHVPKLYRIVLPTGIGAMKDIVEALTDKFGPPTNTSTGSVQNKLGARFSQRTYTWTNSASQIFVQGPWGEVEDMVVIYRLLSLDKLVSDQAQARKKAQKNRM
jgi:hypothetical protein